MEERREQFEMERIQVMDFWDKWYGESEVGFWMLYEYDFDQWWSMVDDETHHQHWKRWDRKPEQDEVEMEYEDWRFQVEIAGD